MTTPKHCSLRTFWLGYCDWFRERAAMTHGEALAEARAELRKRPPILPFVFVSLLFGALLLFAALMPAVVAASSSAGLSSRDVAIVSQWGTVTVVAVVIGMFAVSRARRLRKFCAEMCERGHAVEARLAKERV